MTGWLVVNGFLNSKKFEEIYGFLLNSARDLGVELVLKRSDELGGEIFGGVFGGIFGQVSGVCGEGSARGVRELVGSALPDFVLFWDKDVYLARRFEMAGVRVFNSSRAIEICDNKILTALALTGQVELPKTIIAPKTFEGVGFNKLDFLKNAVEVLGLPMVIKEAFGSFGQQVYLAKTFDQAVEIVKKIGFKDFLMQEFVTTSFGRDVRINVVGGEVIACMKRQNDSDFRSNITNGGKMFSTEISHEWKQIALDAVNIIGLDFAGVDVLFGKDDTPILCEVNSNPHFKSTLDCTGIDLSRWIISHIKKHIAQPFDKPTNNQ